ncbi:hypothetical protein WJX72_002909 [[Myrmecia] bisecta]|uniref:Uncharacterized protein n=1 Tax=[Myrmecia] bisecta TaxID=41462 RepID=A0AAW1P0Q2_9CHLO
MGSIPNLYYRAISMDQLRAHPHFNGLPPVEKVPLYNTQSYRYIRQDNPLWDALHSGVLTTGILNGTLGFYEQGASKRLGIPWSMVSHAPLLTAYNRLQEPIYTPPLMQAPMHSTRRQPSIPSCMSSRKAPSRK